MTEGVYLLHFDRPYEHARHYFGWSSNIEARVEAHRAGRGSRLCEVIRDAGIGFVVARIWRGATRAQERRLSAYAATASCPICTPGAGRGRWPADLERTDGHRPEPRSGRCWSVDPRSGRVCRRRVYAVRRPRIHYRHAPRRARMTPNLGDTATAGGTPR